MNRWIKGVFATLVACLCVISWVVPAQLARAALGPVISEVGAATDYTVAPSGDVTVGCRSARDLKTYDETGSVVRQLDHTEIIDGSPNCIFSPTVGPDGTLYGRTTQWQAGLHYGPNLLAYDGSTLRWKYPVTCTSSGEPNIAVGANGTVYVTTETSSGTHLIGLNPILGSGQTQPAVVTDITLNTGCNVRLFPYNGGIAVREFTGTYLRFSFYSETGVYQGQTSAVGGAIMGGATNADGTLFSMSSSDTKELSAYNPQGQNQWSYASEFWIDSIHPTPDGGVLLLLNANYGNYHLRKLSAAGVKVGEDASLPVDNGNDVTYGGPRVVVNGTGQAIVGRSAYDSNSNTSSSVVSIVSTSMRVRTVAQLSGYEFNGDEPLSMRITKDSVVFQAYDSSYNNKLLTVHVPNAGFEYPQSNTYGVANTVLKYVAMGDSFSSGEGVVPFLDGTNLSSNKCHRSAEAWPMKLEADTSFNKLDMTHFVACSGAVINYIINQYNQENVELPQAAFISDDTQLATITIGGNDVDFGNVLTACTLPTEKEGSAESKHQIEHNACIAALDDALSTAANSAFQNKLQEVYAGTRSLGNSDFQLIVGGYPNLFPKYQDIVGSCVWGGGYLGTSGRSVASDEIQKTRMLHDSINTAIENAVNALNDENVHFVDPSSEFVGHELCRPSPWFNNVVPDIDPVMRNMSYHPNESGQVAYATVMKAKISSLFS